jgi:catechol 2,3-dioxygenase-like lactoylglutathione lyase family enzyme
MKIHRMTHVGFVAPDIEAAVGRWSALFDLTRTATRPTWLAAEEGVLSTMMYVTGLGIEPMQAMTAGGPFVQALAAGRGVFHISFRVDDIEAVARRMWAHDLWAQLRPAGEVVKMQRLWLDPATACGAHIEMIDRAERDAMMNNPAPEGDAPVVAGTEVEKMVSAIHIAEDLSEARRLYHDALGFACAEPVDLPEEGVRTQRFTIGDGAFGGGEGGPAIDVVQVVDPRSPLGEVKAAFGYGIGAWALKVRDLDRTKARLAALECWMRERPATADLPRRLWVHPRSTCGVPLVLLP